MSGQARSPPQAFSLAGKKRERTAMNDVDVEFRFWNIINQEWTEADKLKASRRQFGDLLELDAGEIIAREAEMAFLRSTPS
jgi:hypothetical protein